MTTALRTKEGYGDFGVLSENYRTARNGFPDESIAYIFEVLGKKNPRILDMGCGTGIATTQLYKRGVQLVGTDVDAKMIQQANAENPYEIQYQVAHAGKQPFENKRFDAVTAFSAFHWFANTETLNEIKRILKPDGVFFVVNKNEVGDFKRKNKEILQRFISDAIPDVKKEYNPKKILEKNGFQSVQEQHFSTTEYFSSKEALAYIQTMSVWNLVPVVNRYDALNELHTHFSLISNTNGTIARELDVTIVSGRVKY